MASTFTNTILSSTYKDDYKDSNNFHRILFNSGRALQARELTQMQTIINKEIERFGGNIFKDGAMVRPGGVTVNNQIEYIKLNTSSNTLPADPNTLVGLEVTGATSGVKAKVIDVLKDSGAGLPATLYVHYTDTTGGTAGSSAIRMTASENITSSAGTLTVDSSATATGIGTRASVNEGDYYVQGHFVNAQAQSKIIDRYSGTPSKDLGFVVQETVVSAGDDDTLYDNQGASPNLSAPGADRYKINLQLTTKDTLIGDSSWCHVANVVNGTVTTQPEAINDYNRINHLLATRTKEESGDYIAKQFLIKFDSSDDSSLSLNVSSGVAYIDGYRAAPDTSLPLTIKRAQSSATYNNEASGANYGNYVYVQDSGCDGITIAAGSDRGAKGIPQLMVDSCTIYDKAGGEDAAGNAIGKCRLKAIEKGGNSGVGGNSLSTYKYYLSNIEMYSGKPFRNTKSIGQAANVWFNPVLKNGKAVLNETTNNNLFFTLPKDRPKAFSDFNLTVQRRLTGTTDASGALTFGTLSNETYTDTTLWTFASVDSATFEPTVTGAGTTSAAITGGPKSKNIVALAYINKAVAATASERTKSLATVSSYPPVITSGGVTYYDLQKPDIYEVTSIQDTNSSGVDISSKFILDNGQRDNYYDKGRLILKPGQTQTNPIYVVFKHFTHGAGQFFTAQSYGVIPYSKIPSHTTKAGETIELRNVYDFRHAVDSAGKFGSAGFASIKNEIPRNTDIISADIEYYLPRRDKLVVNKEGEIEYLYGASGYETKEVDNPDGTMPLYNINMNAFTINDSDLSLEKIEAKRYTMQDIGQVEKRIERLEETTALSLMEVDTRNFEVLDSSGNNRTKSGFIVDNFANHFQTDTQNYEHRASIDPKNKILRPSFWEDNVRLLYDSATSKALSGGSHGVVQKGDNLYLEHYEDSAYSNLLATQTENVNPFAVISHVGHIDLSPASDDWKESRKAAPKVIDGGVKIDKSQANNWNNWEWNWTGQDAAALATGTTLSERQSSSEIGNQLVTYKQTNYVASNEVIREKIGERVLDIALIPYMRSKKIFFRAQGLKPNTQVFAFFNGTPIADWVRTETSFERYANSEIDYGSRYNKATGHPDTASTLTTTDSGSILGSFFIPNTDAIKFRTGDVEFKLLDISVNQDSVSTSGAKEYFTSRGVLETVEETLRSTRNIKIVYGSNEISRREMSRPADNRDWDRNPGFTTTGKFSSNKDGSGRWSESGHPGQGGQGRLHRPPSDPIAQSFYVKENSGIFITKARIFFQAKDANIPVCVQLRPMVNGVPSSNIIPGAIKYLPPASVNVSATPSSITDVRGAPTDFEFEEPVYLSPYREYALVVRAETNGYKVYTCRGGDFLVGSTEARVSKQPSLGSFFKSQNGSTWTADQHSDMMFTLFKANFVNTGKATLETGPTAPVLLNTDPITTTNASTTITVAHQGHGFVVGDLVSINGVTTSDSASFVSAEMGGSGNSGILGSEIDGGREIVKADWTGYTFVADGSAASGSVSGGGSALRATQNHQFDQFMPNLQVLTPPGTALEAATKFHSGKGFGDDSSAAAYTIDTNWTAAQINRNNVLSAPRMIASRENELAGSNIDTSNNPNQRSGLVGIAMGTNDSRVSPVIDMQRASLTVVNNIIDKQSSTASTNGFSIPINYKAETDPIGGSSASKHISKTITLAEDAVGIKAIIAANVPANSTFDLYYKTGTDDDVMDDLSWVLASRENAVTYDDNPNVYRDHTYLIGGQGGNEIAAFTKFKLKIVFVGSNSSKVPTIKDMRVIALAT